MKFCKKYEEYMQGQKEKKNLPGVGFKKLKKILKRCRRDHVPSSPRMAFTEAINQQHDRTCPRECPVCDGTFFPELLKEMEDVVGWFNENAQKLLELHLASGFTKCLAWFKGNTRKKDHLGLIQEGNDLVNYALINAVAIRKILKKYDKIHESRQGQLFKTQVQKMRIEILQSPWLCELMAFHINLKESGALVASPLPVHALFDGCSLMFDDGKPLLSCELSDSVKVDIDLTCSICLDTVFDPIALTCGHIYCYMCACSAASVNVVDGLKTADPTQKCPLCREDAVYKAAVHLDELNILLKRSCREYWKERRKTERAERLQQAKEYWDYQCRTFTGI